MKQLKNLLLALPVILLAACQSQPATDKWETLDKPDFSVSYPAGWEMNTSGYMGSSFFVMDTSQSADESFRENVNLIIQETQNMELKAFAQITEDQLRSAIEGFKVVKKGDAKLSGFDAYEMVFTGTQGENKLKWKQVYTIQNNKVYVVTFTSGLSSYDSHIATTDKIIASLKIK